ncbi:MBL fold metallo-hydrolase [Sphingobacterium psychroaquaticum]|uniref:Phosphoribosyl 1,2-cyclic phosphodiesterase n=1 Tax=Sphingobacterium psychroaquaticum TaxID=561061 RepID=A0A1X7JUB9_9SPHI|nr:MBL fold metallo-hydrolase [Sphingobacterium psychroaquaticum]SMG31901.1 Phosphoribosyl 1,2-cyclic phosphodiesterase [Sphingobacterium psychroaquaticum]
MRLHIINSNSDGNCYLFTDNEGNTLIVECGVRFEKIKQALNFDLSRVVGSLVTHEHGDHCKGAKDAVKAGIDVYATVGTIKGLKFESHRLIAIPKGKAFNLGPFSVIAFDTHHDVNEPCGFLIKHEEMGTTLFLTDTIYCDFSFCGLNNILIEANYSQDIIDEKLSGNRFLRNRVIQSHMSIETCIETLKANDLRAVNNIVLIHLSDRNSDAKVFKQRIEDATLKTVSIATAGLTLENFDLLPF